MAIELNHTIVAADEPASEAEFFTEIFGLAPASTFGVFLVVEFAHGLSFDFLARTDFDRQHDAFLVSEDEFTEIFGRIVERGLDHWADPRRERRGEINHNDGGRGVYFPSPSGHVLEIITRPHGSGS